MIRMFSTNEDCPLETVHNGVFLTLADCFGEVE